MSVRGTEIPSSSRSRVAAWALWDCGATGVNAVAITFVFSVYLTEQVGAGLPGDTTPASWLGRMMTIAGIVVALLAPVTGVWVDGAKRRRTALVILTGLAIALTASMYFIRADYHYLIPGLVLLACLAACSDLATVPYNAMLSQLSTDKNSGRISGLGLGAGFVGSVMCLLIVYFGFVAGDGPTRGLLGVPAADGQNVRLAMLLAAAWFAGLAWPLLLSARGPLPDETRTPVGFFGAYAAVWSALKGEWRRDRNVVYYLVASAVFRDGLTGVFAFGAVLGVSVYGVSQADVLIFGVCASVVAAVGAVIGGLLDDRVGSKPLIVGALSTMIVIGIALLSLSGPLSFWVCGLLLCLCIGPVMASARALMLRLSAPGKEGVSFGLYTMTGRAASFLAPWLFFMFIDIFGADRAGLGGLCAVLLLGLVLVLGVRVPAHQSRRADAKVPLLG